MMVMTEQRPYIPAEVVEALKRTPNIYVESWRGLNAIYQYELARDDASNSERVLALDARLQQMEHHLGDLVQARTMVPANTAYELKIFEDMFEGLEDYRKEYAKTDLPDRIPTAKRLADFDDRQVLLDTIDRSLPIIISGVDAAPDRDLDIPALPTTPLAQIDERSAAARLKDFKERWVE